MGGHNDFIMSYGSIVLTIQDFTKLFIRIIFCFTCGNRVIHVTISFLHIHTV